jgi:acetoacetyl-CoA synthetase
VVDVPAADASDDAWMPLFVVLAEGVELDDAIEAELRRRIRSDCSPRHVPDEVIQVAALPRTLSGKVLEVPVKRILMGGDPATAASRDSLADPAALDWFVQFARERAAR